MKFDSSSQRSKMVLKGEWVLLLLLVTLNCVSTKENHLKSSALHDRMTREELEWYFGVSSPSQVPQYEVVSPFLSNDKGVFKTYQLQSTPKWLPKQTIKPRWHYMIPLQDTVLLLTVTPSNELAFETVTIETHHRNGSITNTTLPEMSLCLGHVISYPGSTVAISNHDGLEGLIQTERASMFIRPLSRRLMSGMKRKHGERLHIVTQIKREKRDVINTLEEDHQISKRSQHKYLEMAIVADEFAITSIGEKAIYFHLMMLVHLTNSMFHDESIGERKIAVVVIKIILKKDGFGYRKDASNKDKLSAFTSWSLKTFPRDDKDGRHPDMVSLVTKGRSGGLAKYTSTCFDPFGTNIANDFGLGTAQIIAHETAHTLGVGHDVDNGCPDGRNLMSTAITGGKDPLRWSSCSRKQFQKFLSGPESSCLDDEPRHALHEPDMFKVKLPGQVYDGNAQCRVAYGPKYSRCKQHFSNCGSLFCSSNGVTCHSPIAPPLDGTKCGERHWCIKGECIDDGTSMVNGGWTSWSYTTCTHSCGGGVHWKERTCTKPIPAGGGMKCEGPDKLLNSYQICNPHACPKGSQASRDVECGKYKPSLKGYVSSDEPCILKCQTGSFVYTKGHVKDGTRCSNEPNVYDICIQGKCRNVGCDHVFESGIKIDRCGHCNGDSTKCQLVHGVYTNNYKSWVRKKWMETTTRCGKVRVSNYKYSKSKSKRLSEDRKTKRNLCSQGIQDTKGNYLISIPSNGKTVKAAGTSVIYHSKNIVDKEWIYIKGPITQELRLMFIYMNINGKPNKGVNYQYYAPGKSVVTADQVIWKYSSWSACSQQCAGGQQKRSVECIRNDDKTFVNDKVCERRKKKPDKIRECNTSPCRPEWSVSLWQPCSKTCGKGTQTRHVVCRERVTQERYKTVDDHPCGRGKPTPLSRTCNKIACPPEWVPLEWGKCSKTCAGGRVTRNLACRRLNEHGAYMSLVPHMCRHAPRPPTQEPCNSDVLCPFNSQVQVGITPSYKSLGCYRDGDPHSVPVYLGNMRSQIKWTNMKATVDACARLVKQRNPTYKVFGVKFYGECWSGPKALMTYSEYGKSQKDCYSGVGKHYTYYVYKYL